ncbi:MAG: uracil-DNA glycosylase [Pseudomonadota bacterium]|nr:uracil-DNA glycosylase [Pseudomonadota bacterium]
MISRSSPISEATAALSAGEPPSDCRLCPRLAAYRANNSAANPSWFNAPVPWFGDPRAWLAIVGLAPGLRGANRTGRPFTGDFAGELLYATLAEFGLASGTYAADPADGLVLEGALIINAVRCAPPDNKPTGGEIATCNRFLKAQLAALPALTAVLALGRIAHAATITATGAKASTFLFAHGQRHCLNDVTVFDSYHCSRYNTNTGRLTRAMFRDVFAAIVSERDRQRRGVSHGRG